VSGDGVKGSNNADAQRNVPEGATTARPAGNGTHGQVTWVGAQHLMQGYCGRSAVVGAGATNGSPRPLQRPRNRPLRIGPAPLAETGGAPARAA